MVEVIYVKNNTKKLERKIPEDEIEAFKSWLRTAQYRDKFCYHVGKYVSGTGVARIAMEAFEKGRVTLFQKRSGENFEYWAQRTSRWEA